MTQLNPWMRLALVLTLVLVGVFGVTQSARADGVIYGDTIPAGEVVDDDVILTGDNVMIDGTVNGDVLAIGTSVTINGTVGGSLVTAGQTVFINGQVEGSVYSAALTLELGPSSLISRSLYYGGLSLVAQPGSQVGRDLVAASLGAQLSGEVGRDLRAIIGPLEFVRIFIEAVGGEIGGLETGAPPISGPGRQEFDQAEIGGLLASIRPVGGRSAGYAAPVSGALVQARVRAETGEPEQVDGPGLQVDAVRVREWILVRLRELVTLLVVGLLAVWLAPSLLSRGAERVRTKPLPAAGYGLLALVLAFNIFAVAGLLAVLFLVIGLWLGSVTLWDLAFIFWGVGYSSLGLAVSVFALFVIYGSKVIVSYLAGLLILKRLVPQAAEHKVLPLLLGLVLYVLLHAIPILGWAIGVVVTGLGLGAAWLVYRDKRLLARQTAAESE